LPESKRRYAHKLPPSKPFNHLDLSTERPQILAAIEDFNPTILIGVSTVGKLFSKEIVEAMSRLNARPIIFALSNPIEKHECLPQDAYAWSSGKAIYAGGVQFPPVHYNGQTFLPSQANNLYVFPAVGMAIYATNAKRVTDEMFIEAAHAVADQVRPDQLKLGMLFPPQSNILGDRDSNRGASGEARIRFRARSPRATRGHGRVHPRTCLQARIFRGGSRRLKGGLGRSLTVHGKAWPVLFGDRNVHASGHVWARICTR
jgi:Malic enzyme, NAD binding domain